ncbi:MAG: SDR family oxidoreductase [Acidimicrobiia bacterium]|nr:SDR family oxidoreductase [Acidimicrobiia bacterium]
MSGRTAIVTGASRGIGAAVAGRLARAGALVLLAARTSRDVSAVAARLTRDGLRAHAVACDVSVLAGVEALAAEARAVLDRVDILVNNAGAAVAAPVQKTSLEEWERMLSVNATSAFLAVRAFLPGMIEAGWGRIVNVASTAGLRGDRYISAYAASKHALLGLTRSVAVEVATTGVTVNAVCPGYVDTRMTELALAGITRATGRTRDEALAAIEATSPQRRLLSADEVAAAVLYLCGDEAQGVNGASLVLDGGELRR